jgi:hypothetical protein
MIPPSVGCAPDRDAATVECAAREDCEDQPLAAIAIAFITLAGTFGCAVIGMSVRSWLPPPHLSKESQDVVRLGMGLVATMTALLLGLVTASAKSTFDTQDTAIRNSAASILTLDRHLARYGPETAPTRELIRRAVAYRIQTVWSSNDSQLSGLDASKTPPIEEIENQILQLSPANDTQRWFKAEALKLSQEVVKTRWRVLSATSGSVPRSFLVVVIFWLTVTFTSFGLYAPRNATVLAVLFMAAVSVAAAVFLILELDGPLDGLIKISSEPLEFVLTQLGG